MTRTATTVWTITCDGILATACDPAHPDKPHTCPASLTTHDPLALHEAAAAGRWLTTTDDPEHHYCPSHRHQAHTDTDCTAPGFSGEGRCIEPATTPGGFCTTHAAHLPGVVATP